MEQYVYTYDSFAQRGAEQYVPTERFQVKSSVYLPASDIDRIVSAVAAHRP